MGIFKELFSGHLLRRSTTPSMQPAIREVLPCCAAAAAAAESDPGANEQRMLPRNHPQTIRVQRMAAHLIGAACDDTNYGRRRLSRRIRRPFDGIDWAVGVVDAGYVNGFSTSTGDIVVSTGLLGYLRKDAAIATVLGHEVGHVIARHIDKRKRNRALVGFLSHFAGELLDAPPCDRRATRGAWRSLFMRPCYFSQEYEADRLGLLLLAAAGYDPRAGPPMYSKLGEIGDAAPDDVGAMHPASTKRAQRLSQDKVMGEAMDLYRQAVARSRRTWSGRGAGAQYSRTPASKFGLPCHGPDGTCCCIKTASSRCSVADDEADDHLIRGRASWASWTGRKADKEEALPEVLRPTVKTQSRIGPK